MPPLGPCPRTAQVRVFGHIATHEWQNVLHFTWVSGTALDSDMVELASQVESAYDHWYNDATHYISSDCHVDRVTATDLSTPTGAFGEVLSTSVGLASQVSLAQAAGLISLPIPIRYRGGHGRIYIAGISPDNTTDGRTWTAGTVAFLNSFYADGTWGIWFKANAGSYSGISDVVGSVVQGFEYGQHPPVRLNPRVAWPVEIANVSADGVIRSQRRRVRNTPTNT